VSVVHLLAVVALVALSSADAFATPPAWPVTAHPDAAAGNGGFGRVYRGTDRAARPYAVKFNYDDADTHAEARVLAAINGHHGWPQYYGTHVFNGVFHNRPANITAWGHGVPLDEFVPRDNPQAVRVVYQLLAHLEELHALGWVHGDIKPNNIMIDPARGSRSVLLVDFGNAKRIGQAGRFGTPEYGAPEQWVGQAWTPATDTYAAAGVLVRLLTRQDPFGYGRFLHDRQLPGNSPEVHHMHEQRAVLNWVRDRRLREVLHRALSPDPAHRYTTAAQFAAALLPFVQ
jgi:serine/threonine-protein kinase